jgi:hypothetical protein
MVSRDWPPQNTYERIVGWPSRFCPARPLGRWASNQQHWRNPPLMVRGEISGDEIAPGGVQHGARYSIGHREGAGLPEALGAFSVTLAGGSKRKYQSH